jgi:N-acetylmuramoyl-L-alanine amidase
MRLRILLVVAAATYLAAASAASAAFQHVIAPGESLSSVAAVDGLTVDQLAAANGLSSDTQLVAGSTLMIPPQGDTSSVVAGGSSGSGGSSSAGTSSRTDTSTGDGDGDGDDGGAPAVSAAGAGSSSSSSAGSGSSSGGTGYVVQPGDTLSAIAARAGTTASDLAAANGLDVNGVLPEGAVLQLTSGSGGSSASGSGSASGSASAASAQPVGAVAQGSASSPPYPTPERVSASEVGSIASANGVPASLAQAIGWQESGFNNDLVSSADARGVMQILPGTWGWIQKTLTAGTPLAPASAADNVRGGVLMLHSLLAATGGDPALAAAGYYQGLPSVQQNGMYTDTQQYVNSVMALRQRFGGP